jgi:hypothetical protein
MGFTSCGGQCTNLNSDENNCGACGIRCTGGHHCTSAQCTCPGGFTVCSGLCVNTMHNAEHCGSCGNECAGYQVCMGGVCVIPSPTDGGAPDAGAADASLP